jgi:MraZ protein
MSQFLGTHQNRLDAKGRVSVPAPFRTALRPGADTEAPVTAILRPSHKYACIECWPVAKFEALAASMSKLAQFSDAHEDMAAALYADAFPVEADKEGRIVLPAELVSHANLSGQVSFMGMGDTFQIWEPEAGAARRAEARTGARLRELSLPGAAAA